jgi:hypothetical protein
MDAEEGVNVSAQFALEHTVKDVSKDSFAALEGVDKSDNICPS